MNCQSPQQDGRRTKNRNCHRNYSLNEFFVGRDVESGILSINHHGIGIVELPFGGVKESGYGSAREVSRRWRLI